MRLYDEARVISLEETSAFKNWSKQSSRRKDAAQRAVATKVRKMQEWLANLRVIVPFLEREVLIQQACENYNLFKAERTCYRGYYDDDWEPATPSSDPEFLHRISVNYLRHSMTKYEQLLESTFGQVASHEAYLGISQRVFEAIANVYPWLRNECDRQLRERGGKLPEVKPEIEVVAPKQLSLFQSV